MAATGIPPDQRPVSVSIALIGINGCNDAVDLDDDPVRVSIALIGINGCNANLRGADLEGAFQSPWLALMAATTLVVYAEEEKSFNRLDWH